MHLSVCMVNGYMVVHVYHKTNQERNEKAQNSQTGVTSSVTSCDKNSARLSRYNMSLNMSEINLLVPK